MGEGQAIPFFVYDKSRREAYFIVLGSKESSKKQMGGMDNGEQRIIQEGEFSWTSRSFMGA